MTSVCSVQRTGLEQCKACQGGKLKNTGIAIFIAMQRPLCLYISKQRLAVGLVWIERYIKISEKGITGTSEQSGS